MWIIRIFRARVLIITFYLIGAMIQNECNNLSIHDFTCGLYNPLKMFLDSTSWMGVNYAYYV